MTTEITETATEIAQEAAPASTEVNIECMLKNLDAQVVECKKTLNGLQNGLRVVRKQAFVLQKLASKGQKTKRKKPADGTVRASGFAAASLLSPELKVFMGLTEDTMKSRTEVTKWLCLYIQQNELQGKQDKRYITFESEAGKKLKELLKCDKEHITYFDLQHYLKYHISSKSNPMTGTITVTETSATIVSEPKPEEPKRRTAQRQTTAA
jgi:chromatin remodeling complex protein RSC6